MNSTMNSSNNSTGYFDEDGWHLTDFARENFFSALGLQWLNTVLIISLNTAVIVTILRYKKKSRLYFLLLNMAIADLTTGVIDALVNSLERSLGAPYLNYWWFGGDVLCRIQRTLSSTSLCASNFILAATSIDRALVVAKPMLNFKRGHTLQKVMIALCWTFSAALSSPFAWLHSQDVFDPSYMEGVQHVPHCSVNLDTNGWKIAYFLMLTFYVLIPLTVIIVSYCILISAIYKRANVHGMDNMKISMVFNRGLPRTKVRSIRLTFGIVLSFICAWTPYFVILYLNLYHDFYHPVVMSFITTYYWNCSVNPIIFFIFHKRRSERPSSRFSSSDNKTISKQTISSHSTRSATVSSGIDPEHVPLQQMENM